MIELLTFQGCPHATRARQMLQGLGVPFREVEQERLPEADPLRAYTSPTILKGGKLVLGAKTDGLAAGCSMSIWSKEDLVRGLGLASSNSESTSGRKVSMLGAGLSGAAVAFCPLCYPAIGSLLASFGLGFLVHETAWKLVLITFLAVALLGFLWSYLWEHGRAGPLVLGILFAATLYVGRYVSIGFAANALLEYGSIAGLVGASIWNWKLRKTTNCEVCR